MREDEIITFSFEGLGEVKFTVAKCRDLCPKETLALEMACDKMANEHQSEGLQALTKNAPEIGKLLEALKQALLTEARLRGIQPSEDNIGKD